MSLNPELTEIKNMLESADKLQKELSETAQAILELLTLAKDEWSDNLTELQTTLIEKLQKIAAFQKDILEPNQQTIFQALKPKEETEESAEVSE